MIDDYNHGISLSMYLKVMVFFTFYNNLFKN